jgi:hypothetical protein
MRECADMRMKMNWDCLIIMITLKNRKVLLVGPFYFYNSHIALPIAIGTRIRTFKKVLLLHQAHSCPMEASRRLEVCLHGIDSVHHSFYC